MLLEVAQPELANRVEQFDQLLVALRHALSELGAVHVKIIEEALEVVLAVGAYRRTLDVAEDPLQGLVEVLIPRGMLADI